MGEHMTARLTTHASILMAASSVNLLWTASVTTMPSMECLATQTLNHSQLSPAVPKLPQVNKLNHGLLSAMPTPTVSKMTVKIPSVSQCTKNAKRLSVEILHWIVDPAKPS